MPGVRNATLAGKCAWRELRSLSVPLAIARIKTDRTLWYGYKGMPVVYDFDVDIPIVMRITRINSGSTDNNSIEIELIQDVFSSVESNFTTPPSGWVAPTVVMTEFNNSLALEAPYAIVRRNTDTSPTRLLVMAANQYDGADSITILVDGNSSGVVEALIPLGALDGDIAQDTTTIDVFSNNLEVSQFSAATATSIGQNLTNLILIGNELIAPKSVVEITDGLQLVDCYRGLCDTAQSVHEDGEDVWFICIAVGLNDQSLTPGATVSVKLVPIQGTTAMDSTGITPISVDLDYREDKPYPPSLLSLNSSLFPASVDIDSGVTLTFNRRDWRIYDEVSQLAVDAETLDPTFPTADSTQYAAVLYLVGVQVYITSYNAGTASLTMPLLKIIRYCVGCPATLEIGVRARHNATYDALQDLKHETAVTSVLTNDTFLGIIDTGQISLPWTAPVNGTYAFALTGVLASDLQVKVNGGTLTTVISAGNTKGNLVGVVANDIIEVRHTDSTTSNEVLLTIDAPGVTTDAYACLIFVDVYKLIGGFGRGGFGRGPFGR
jgi:hypothetical protein